MNKSSPDGHGDYGRNEAGKARQVGVAGVGPAQFLNKINRHDTGMETAGQRVGEESQDEDDAGRHEDEDP